MVTLSILVPIPIQRIRSRDQWRNFALSGKLPLHPDLNINISHIFFSSKQKKTFLRKIFNNSNNKCVHGNCFPLFAYSFGSDCPQLCDYRFMSPLKRSFREAPILRTLCTPMIASLAASSLCCFYNRDVCPDSH